jgi:hypothetical protein
VSWFDEIFRFYIVRKIFIEGNQEFSMPLTGGSKGYENIHFDVFRKRKARIEKNKQR